MCRMLAAKPAGWISNEPACDARPRAGAALGHAVAASKRRFVVCSARDDQGVRDSQVLLRAVRKGPAQQYTLHHMLLKSP